MTSINRSSLNVSNDRSHITSPYAIVLEASGEDMYYTDCARRFERTHKQSSGKRMVDGDALLIGLLLLILKKKCPLALARIRFSDRERLGHTKVSDEGSCGCVRGCFSKLEKICSLCQGVTDLFVDEVKNSNRQRYWHEWICAWLAIRGGSKLGSEISLYRFAC